jgi:hypothetical protein
MNLQHEISKFSVYATAHDPRCFAGQIIERQKSLKPPFSANHQQATHSVLLHHLGR